MFVLVVGGRVRGTGGVKCMLLWPAYSQLPAVLPANHAACSLPQQPLNHARCCLRILTFLRACWNMSRTREAPTPTNISMNSVPASGWKGRGGVYVSRQMMDTSGWQRNRRCPGRLAWRAAVPRLHLCTCPSHLHLATNAAHRPINHHPTNHPNTHPPIEKKGTPASPAIAFASSVLPVPGGPTSSAPR